MLTWYHTVALSYMNQQSNWKKNESILIAKQIQKKKITFIFHCFENWNIFQQYFSKQEKNNRTFYITILNYPRKFYLDIDYKIKINTLTKFKIQNIKSTLNELNKYLHKEHNNNPNIYYNIRKINNNHIKVSYHVITNKIMINKIDALKQVQTIVNHVNFKSIPIDKSVYSNNYQLWRLPFCIKIHEPNSAFKPFNSHDYNYIRNWQINNLQINNKLETKKVNRWIYMNKTKIKNKTRNYNDTDCTIKIQNILLNHSIFSNLQKAYSNSNKIYYLQIRCIFTSNCNDHNKLYYYNYDNIIQYCKINCTCGKYMFLADTYNLFAWDYLKIPHIKKHVTFEQFNKYFILLLSKNIIKNTYLKGHQYILRHDKKQKQTAGYLYAYWLNSCYKNTNENCENNIIFKIRSNNNKHFQKFGFFCSLCICKTCSSCKDKYKFLI